VRNRRRACSRRSEVACVCSSSSRVCASAASAAPARRSADSSRPTKDTTCGRAVRDTSSEFRAAVSDSAIRAHLESGHVSYLKLCCMASHKDVSACQGRIQEKTPELLRECVRKQPDRPHLGRQIGDLLHEVLLLLLHPLDLACGRGSTPEVCTMCTTLRILDVKCTEPMAAMCYSRAFRLAVLGEAQSGCHECLGNVLRDPPMSAAVACSSASCSRRSGGYGQWYSRPSSPARLQPRLGMLGTLRVTSFLQANVAEHHRMTSGQRPSMPQLAARDIERYSQLGSVSLSGTAKTRAAWTRGANPSAMWRCAAA